MTIWENQGTLLPRGGCTCAAEGSGPRTRHEVGGVVERGVSLAHVGSVLAVDDRVLRNYWVTQTDADLSAALAEVLALLVATCAARTCRSGSTTGSSSTTG